MKVAFVGDERPAVGAALEAEAQVELLGSPPTLFDSDGEIAELAAALRAFESLFDGERVDRVVVAGSSNLSLAAVLVATKMLIPVGVIEGDDGPAGMNGRLIENLADAALAYDAGAVTAWLREPQQPSQARPEH